MKAHFCSLLLLFGCSRDVELGDRPRVVGGIHISGGASSSGGRSEGSAGSDASRGGTSGSGGAECNVDSAALATDLHGNITGLCGRVHGAWFLRAGKAQVYPLVPRVSVLGTVQVCAAGTVQALALHDVSLGFDFVRSDEHAVPFDAAAEGLRGVSFEVDQVPANGLRVEFEDAHGVDPTPADFFAQAGVNEVAWRAVPALDTQHLLSMVFQVPPGATPNPVQFCVSNVKVLR